MADVTEYMLSTSDNPYNPYTDYRNWYAFDSQHGYHTPEYLARIAKTSDDLSDADQSQAIDQAIDEIVKLNLLGIYIKVPKPAEIAA